jgi:hypothetical protein
MKLTQFHFENTSRFMIPTRSPLATLPVLSEMFRTTEGQSGTLTERPMRQADVYRMIRRSLK